MLSNYNNQKTYFPLFVLLFFFSQACQKEHVLSEEDFPTKLSAANIFSGDLSDLVPSSNYMMYDLASELFSDYAEKQRLIRLPAGTQMTKNADALPNFPEGTSIVKTFYYWNDKRDFSKGKKVFESRVLLLKNGLWLYGTYQWNSDQTEAYLLTSGSDQAVNWINENGIAKATTYHIPNMTECVTCHEQNLQVKPLGPKLHNLNFLVNKNGSTINQLTYFQNIGWIDHFDVNTITAIPNYKDNNLTEEQKSRAYLDANCSHCHNPQGSSNDLDLDLSYHTLLENTAISAKQSIMIDRLESGQMPLLGTSVLDEVYVQQIIQYLNSL
jgi:uncharacterized repeat protein (TIGR03806 family)